jgi:hypothetical protein
MSTLIAAHGEEPDVMPIGKDSAGAADGNWNGALHRPPGSTTST